MEINIKDYTYHLPQERIALHPLPQRDAARLLVSRHGTISHTHFSSLTEWLPENAFLFFNDTKVIPARIHFRKESGAIIEIFLLQPVKPSTLVAEAMQETNTCTWKCVVGNLKRWKDGQVLVHALPSGELHALLVDRNEGYVQFTWYHGQPFASVIEEIGETPLPPYLNRKAEPDDRVRYQTVYSHHEGAVAAPTAGLHFTPAIFDALRTKKIEHDYLTLHVSAGTFQPVKTENALEHVMHREQVVVTRTNVENLLNPDRFIVAVGTTSMRTLESLYWFGVKLTQDAHANFSIQQNDPYLSHTALPTRDEALQAIIQYMDRNETDTLSGETSVFIVPGYTFRVCQGLITNFHQPGSTLILLVAALAGNHWKKIYEEALRDGYRFLSYGDSSLIIP